MPELLKSSACTHRELFGPRLSPWGSVLRDPVRPHRKLWEFYFICQVLEERGLLRRGRRGLGFAVGREPLPAVFAERGCVLVATDLHPDADVSALWNATHQHSQNIGVLNERGICDPETFKKRVSLRYVDMNAIPNDLKGFDFIWSSCSFEHLGSITLGKQFIYNMTKCLRPGGVAVHTTEYNVYSDWFTIETGGSVIFRKRDFEEMAAELPNYGCRMVERDYDVGDHPLDYMIDRVPYLGTPHLKLELEGHIATSFGVIVEKAA